MFLFKHGFNKFLISLQDELNFISMQLVFSFILSKFIFCTEAYTASLAQLVKNNKQVISSMFLSQRKIHYTYVIPAMFPIYSKQL